MQDVYDLKVVFNKNFNVFHIVEGNSVSFAKSLLFYVLGDEINTFATYDDAQKVLNKLLTKLDEIF